MGVKGIVRGISNASRSFLHSCEILRSVKPFTRHRIQIKFTSFCHFVTGYSIYIGLLFGVFISTKKVCITIQIWRCREKFRIEIWRIPSINTLSAQLLCDQKYVAANQIYQIIIAIYSAPATSENSDS